MIERPRILARVVDLLDRFPVVGIIGARQVGKTTLAGQLARRFDGQVAVFDLEDPQQLARLGDPMLAMQNLQGLVVLDEIQRKPELFPVLRVLADRQNADVRFLVLGSASPPLLRQSSESLAGRIAYFELSGFAADEVEATQVTRLWRRGGFPPSFLETTEQNSFEWRQQFVRTFLERDLPQLGVSIPATTIRRFWTMLAHSHGQIWNASAFARNFGVADTTVRRYLDLLASTFVVRQLQPWHENLRKRQVKSPKVYLSDSGLLHVLLNLRSQEDLEGHPLVGASWEGFAAETVRTRLGAEHDECFFWATHAGAEIDLAVIRGRRRLGFEFKRTVAPSVTRSMRTALEDLQLDSIDVVHAGSDTFPLADGIRALALSRVWEDLAPMP